MYIYTHIYTHFKHFLGVLTLCGESPMVKRDLSYVCIYIHTYTHTFKNIFPGYWHSMEYVSMTKETYHICVYIYTHIHIFKIISKGFDTLRSTSDCLQRPIIYVHIWIYLSYMYIYECLYTSEYVWLSPETYHICTYMNIFIIYVHIW